MLKNTPMIQRVQSVLLFLMALSMIALLFFPIWVMGNPDGTELLVLNAFELRMEDPSKLVADADWTKSTWYLAALAVVSAGLSLYSISQYKNRLTQMKLGALNSLVILAIVALAYWTIHQSKAAVSPGAVEQFKFGFFLPLVAVVLNSAANRFIRRDEKLVRDSNRMR